jgi:hypothetical protein
MFSTTAAAMCTSLLVTLPAEILSEILSCFINEKPFLCSLALISRQFSDPIRHLLFRCVVLNPSSFNVRFNPSPERKKFDLFLRTITEYPELASRVQEMSLEWDEGDEQVYQSIEMLLSKLHCLRTISLSGSSDLEEPVDFQHNFLTTGSMNSLSSANIDIAESSSDDMIKYMSLPRLKSMHILSYAETPSSWVLHSRGGSNPYLRELKLLVHLFMASLSELLALFPIRTSLTTYLPGYHDGQGYYHRPSTVLSPSEFSQ